ncbi:MAG: LysR substrate-binding domain-containing protein [Verrucomicrobiales bacterium]|nr:LysR substrate-binding domain-containing protein [Verrucomicrobiales bacterium]
MDDFSFRELECFLAVAAELSFTRAAKLLHMAQPPLSRHIKNMEEKLGTPLFVRSNRQVELTKAGEVFREEARDILIHLRRAAQAAKRVAGGEIDQIEIGFVSAVLSEELVRVFSRFRKRHPEVQLNLKDRLPADQIASIEKGELDIGFIGIVPESLPSGIVTTEWRAEDLMAFLPPAHPLSGAERVKIADLGDEPFVMISASAAPAFVSHLHGLCREVGFRPRVIQEASRAQAVAAMTVAGSGVAILPAALNRLTGNGVPLVEARNRKSRITHAVAHRVEMKPMVREFLGVVAPKWKGR